MLATKRRTILFGKSVSLVEIFNYSHDDISTIAGKIENFLGVDAATDVKKFLNNQKILTLLHTLMISILKKRL